MSSSWFSWAGIGHNTSSPGTLQTSGNLSRDVFLEFSKVCIDKFSSKDLLQELREAIENKKDPEDTIEMMQFKEFEKLGVQGHYGISQLSSIQRNFRTDQEVMQAFLKLVTLEEAVLDKAQLAPEQIEAKAKAQETLVAVQLSLQQLEVTLPEASREQFRSAVQDAMRSASLQVPKPENASIDEAVAAVHEQMRCACEQLRKQGYAIPEDIELPRKTNVGDASAEHANASVGSSVMTAEEQHKFLQSFR